MTGSEERRTRRSDWHHMVRGRALRSRTGREQASDIFHSDATPHEQSIGRAALQQRAKGHGLLCLVCIGWLANAAGLAPAFSESALLGTHHSPSQQGQTVRGARDFHLSWAGQGRVAPMHGAVQTTSATMERVKVTEAAGIITNKSSNKKGIEMTAQVESILQRLHIESLHGIVDPEEVPAERRDKEASADLMSLKLRHSLSAGVLTAKDEEVISHSIVSWPKDHDQDLAFQGSVRLESASSLMPHPLKAYRGGEDVRLEVTVGGHTLLGVFDGVGGWADIGVDPALYTRRMSDLIRMEFERNPEICLQDEKPLMVFLQAAYDELKRSELPGSCTVCLVLVTSEGQMHVLNIGDSGLHIVRDGVSVFCTQEQQHFFNCPYQLGMGSDDCPNDAEYCVLVDIAVGDVIVAATDGMWDNVYEDDMVSIVADNKHKSPAEIAQRLAELSHVHGADTSYNSPFSRSAAALGLKMAGGKLDDVTVVVSRVCEVVKGREEDKWALLTSPVSSMESEDEAMTLKK